MAITIQMIKELREATAAGMGACKEALTATNGNMEEAVKYLREKGLAVAAKRVDKESKQGIVALCTLRARRFRLVGGCKLERVRKLGVVLFRIGEAFLRTDFLLARFCQIAFRFLACLFISARFRESCLCVSRLLCPAASPPLLARPRPARPRRP